MRFRRDDAEQSEKDCELVVVLPESVCYLCRYTPVACCHIRCRSHAGERCRSRLYTAVVAFRGGQFDVEPAHVLSHRGGDVQGVVRHDADVLVRGEEVAGVRLYCTRQIHRIHRCLVSVDTNPLRGVVHRQTVATGREQRVEHVGRRAHVLFPPADAQCVCLRYVRLGALSAPVRGYDHRPTVGVRRVIEVVLHARGQYGHRTY